MFIAILPQFPGPWLQQKQAWFQIATPRIRAKKSGASPAGKRRRIVSGRGLWPFNDD
jgi:hypothetical protein